MEKRKDFIAINEEFICLNCGEKNSKLNGSYRNHCRKCLHSLHVDKDGPGDRLSDCGNLMYPIKVDQNGKKGWMIYHKCTKCGKIISNKVAEDDNFDKIIQLTYAPDEPTRSEKTGK